METEFSKRVYQGVRVKHTVKDLLAERRSRQTSGPRFTSVSAQSPFTQVTGSNSLQGYYSMRRQFFSEAEFFPSSKQFSTNIYSSSLAGKSLSSDTTTMSSYSSLIDGYYPEAFSDFRSAAHSGGGSALFSSSALSTLIPPLPVDASHFLQRDSWEHAGVEMVESLCGNSLALAPVEPSSPSQYRSTSRGSSMVSSQFFCIHALDDMPYQTSFQLSPSFPCPTYSDSAAKLPALSTEDPDSTHSTLNDTRLWAEEDTPVPWPHCDIRRTFR